MPRKSREKWFDIDKNGCWICNYSPTKGSYRQKWDGKRLVGAHRYSYELINGKIEKGMEIDHLCKNHACVNPDHLEKVTKLENIKRGNLLKIPKNELEKIRFLYNKKSKSQIEIAKIFGVSQSEISRILCNKRRQLI